MTTLGPRAAKLRDAIQEIREHERGKVTLPVTDWKQAATWAADRIAVLEAENKRLREALAEAANDIESWGAYASYFFQQKYDLQGAIDKTRSALKEQP